MNLRMRREPTTTWHAALRLQMVTRKSINGKIQGLKSKARHFPPRTSIPSIRMSFGFKSGHRRRSKPASEDLPIHASGAGLSLLVSAEAAEATGFKLSK